MSVRSHSAAVDRVDWGRRVPPRAALRCRMFEDAWPRPPDDDLEVRPAGLWTADKLAIVRYYLPGFANACAKAKTFHFVDGFAGPGVNLIAEERVAGSPLIALETPPAFAKCLLMDANERVVNTLQARTASYGDRAVVERGDCNADLLPLMQRHLGGWDPALVLLDPEGCELSWEAVQGIASFRPRRHPLGVIGWVTPASQPPTASTLRRKGKSRCARWVAPARLRVERERIETADEHALDAVAGGEVDLVTLAPRGHLHGPDEVVRLLIGKREGRVQPTEASVGLWNDLPPQFCGSPRLN
jgi:hypothetical protein